MKAITLWQPWAILMAYELKKFETRSWETNYRGPIAIHAAMRWDNEIRGLCKCEPFATCLKKIELPLLPTGCILATGRLTNCFSTADLQSHHNWFADHAAEYERDFGDYTAGRFAWKIEDIQRLDEPIPARGYQGLWNWQPPVLARLPEPVQASLF